ncbi:ABC transporter permease subunit [Streptomyces sp. NPDC058297]|uniref:ABC transporter permease subunit n=1 Tax=Streptomyces sp. NPDC058297 TaxID=3346433 RepID=UPI0036E9546A
MPAASRHTPTHPSGSAGVSEEALRSGTEEHRGPARGAKIDGAGGIRTALTIKLPMIRPAIALSVLFTVIGSVQLFTEPKVIYSASSSIGSSWTPNMYVQTAAFTHNDFGLAAAASLLIALFAAVLSFLVTRFSRSRSQA